MSDSQTTLDPLLAVSPLDGRYRRQVEKLSDYASEYGLIRYRVQIEIEWFLHLSEHLGSELLAPLDNPLKQQVRDVYCEFSLEDAKEVKNIEGQTNHDVKAVEYFVKDRLAKLGLTHSLEYVHFGCTSEDINNLSYALMLSQLRSQLLVPALDSLIQVLIELATPLTDVPMLARTHGQAASPTTVGKELAVFVDRLASCLGEIEKVEILGKMNGAVGNFNAHVIALPQFDWPAISAKFIRTLDLQVNEITTQIEPHDFMARYCRAIAAVNQVLLDFDRDIWAYISLGYFKQKQVEGEVGSSTMPHKVNPIDFENSEGNIGLANALLEHLASKLPVSRWQRDLSDSTVQRNIGSAVGYSLAAYASAKRGISKLSIDEVRISAELDDAWEVLTEAIQTAMRVAGSDEPYERVKELTRGRQLNHELFLNLLDELNLPQPIDAQLRQLTPTSYIGLATKLASATLERISNERS